jgi:hypothetical protein
METDAHKWWANDGHQKKQLLHGKLMYPIICKINYEPNSETTN